MKQTDSRVVIEEIYRRDSRRVLATLIRLFQGNFDLAEEALQDAFMAAVSQWATEGIPDNPRAWLVSAGRFKAIDRLRKRSRFDATVTELARELETHADADHINEEGEIGDDRLRLIFTCCHPSLSGEARVALTLREVCGLNTEEIAAAFLVPTPTLAQRIVRAKTKIRDARIPYEVPGKEDLAERLNSVLQVIYLVFNEGYSSSGGESVTRQELSAEAIRLCRLLRELLPEAEVTGLLALMLLHDSRREARSSAGGDLIPLEEQDRSLWNREQIGEGCRLAVAALKSGRPGPYTIQAAIAAVHAEAATPEQTDWSEIAGLYDILLRLAPSPVVELNRAVAIAMRDGPAAGLELVNQLLNRGDLEDYHLAHAARADLHRRLGNTGEAREAYERALALSHQEPERRFIQRRLAELG